MVSLASSPFQKPQLSRSFHSPAVICPAGVEPLPLPMEELPDEPPDELNDESYKPPDDSLLGPAPSFLQLKTKDISNKAERKVNVFFMDDWFRIFR